MARRAEQTAPRGASGPATGAAGPVGGADGAAEPAPAPTAGEVLARYLHEQSAEFLRGLRLHREAGPDADRADRAARHLRRAARRIGGVLHTFQPLTDEVWAEQLRTELRWLNATLGREERCATRREQLTSALRRLTRAGAGGTPCVPAAREGGRGTDTACADAATPDADREPEAAQATLTAGAARAGALLDRRLALARSRAHSAALQALQSARFHAVADAVALLASEVPLTADAARPPGEALVPLAEQAHLALREAVAGLGPKCGVGAPDAPWLRTRHLLRHARHAQDMLDLLPDHQAPSDPRPREEAARLARCAGALARHRAAVDAATAAAEAARTPRIAPATAYALGVLHADQRHEAAAARLSFDALWGRTAPTSRCAAPTASGGAR